MLGYLFVTLRLFELFGVGLAELALAQSVGNLNSVLPLRFDGTTKTHCTLIFDDPERIGLDALLIYQARHVGAVDVA